MNHQKEQMKHIYVDKLLHCDLIQLGREGYKESYWDAAQNMKSYNINWDRRRFRSTITTQIQTVRLCCVGVEIS